MRSTFQSVSFATLFALTSLAPIAAHAQFTYTYYPNNTAINSDVTTDFAIVGYAGGSYNDDFTRNFTGPTSPTVQVVDGANVTTEVDSFNNSVVNVTGGTIVGFVPDDNSILNISGGSTSYALIFDNAVINLSNGYVSDLEGQGKAINVTGGTVDTLVANQDSDPSGTSVLGSCIVGVTGGAIGEADAYNEGVLNIRGGTYTSNIR